MAKTKREIEQFYRENYRAFGEDFLTIKTKQAKLRKFRFNEAQEIIDSLLEKQRKENGYVRAIILKARREGCSTYVGGRFYHKSSLNKNRHVFIVAHEAKATNTLFEMVKLFHQKNPISPSTLKNNSRTLQFDTKKGAGLKSEYAVGCALNLDTGRSSLIHYLHGSEVAFWRDAETLMTGLMQCVPDPTDMEESEFVETEVILESTANGMGGYFYDMYWSAKRGENEFIAIFLPWFVLSEYMMSLSDREKLPKATPDDVVEEKKLKKMFRQYNLNPKDDAARLKWRRWKIRNSFKGDVDKFRQEYPATDTEAFLTSGRPAFNVKILDKRYPECPSPSAIGELIAEPKTPFDTKFEPGPIGNLKIWKFPGKGKNYIIGGDPAEGIQVKESEKQGDASCLQVVCRETLEQVACWHGHIEEHYLAWEAVKLGYFYNTAWLGIERNNMGHSTIRHIEAYDYPRLFHAPHLDTITGKWIDKPGWLTDLKTRPLIIGRGKAAISNGEVLINDAFLIIELLSFVYDKNGRPGAMIGCYDDRVMSWLIAVYLHGIIPYENDSDEPEKQKEEEVHLAWKELKMIKDRLKNLEEGMYDESLGGYL